MFAAISTNLPAASPAPGNLRQELDAGLEDSLNYQILRRTLMPEEAAETAVPVTEPSPEDTQLSAANSSVSASQFSAVLEQRTLSLKVEVQAEPAVVDPLVLDLASNGFRTSGLQRSVSFDLNADGHREQISAPTGDDALLAWDRNGNGSIDDGRELFGDQHGASHGFAELARFDDNHDGRIDSQDAIYQQLSLLRFNAQGQQSQQRLSDAGVSAIYLHNREVNVALGAYDRIAQLGHFDFADGRSGQAADLLLATRQA
ncbi:hypothetical protein [Pseudomonas sp. 5P_3.1_Bac2]|uniref:hypothetical protein n=1 Tax=Pseudomonas sp. 5P_3.1_Bac2 TaxID=2971617 RepID=UPI0021C9EEB5|nr:hypothetical protein [Pseudomonas sp. 5P_3.1_Bac2]MCU1719643.1 hypothetical protein [Pseudomonas sp. 5P_3.1_Bac2]